MPSRKSTLKCLPVARTSSFGADCIRVSTNPTKQICRRFPDDFQETF